MLSLVYSIDGNRSIGKNRKLITPKIIIIRNTIVVAIGRLTDI